MVQVLATGGLVSGAAKVDGAGGADNAPIGRDRASGKYGKGMERGSSGGNEKRGGGERWRRQVEWQCGEEELEEDEGEEKSARGMAGGERRRPRKEWRRRQRQRGGGKRS